jgi:hypothetical protein
MTNIILAFCIKLRYNLHIDMIVTMHPMCTARYDIVTRWKWSFIKRIQSDLCCIWYIVRYIYVIMKCFHNKWRSLFQSWFYFMYHSLCLEFALDLCHNRKQMLLLYACGNALNVDSETRRYRWNIRLRVSWFRNNFIILTRATQNSEDA